VRDDPAQTAKADACIEQFSKTRPGFISIVAIAETAWVLKSVYKYADAHIAAAVEGLLHAEELVVQDEQQVFSAVAMLKEGRGSLGDALIGALGNKAGCDHTLTFDRKSTKLPEFELL
jgi:predicted nucleic-acid-binding protein